MRTWTKELRRRLDRRWWTWFLAASLAMAVLFLALPTLFWWSGGGFRERRVFDSTSPDGRFQVVVSSWVTFPANELWDPAIEVQATLHNVRTGLDVDYITVGLDEKGRLGSPVAEWLSDAVVIRRINPEHDLSVTLKATGR